MTMPLYISQLTPETSNGMRYTFGVYGYRTSKHAHELKALGGRFSPMIHDASDGKERPAWIFPASLYEKVSIFVTETNVKELDHSNRSTASSDKMYSFDVDDPNFITSLIRKTKHTSIISKEVVDNQVTYTLYSNDTVNVAVGDTMVAEFADGSILVVDKEAIDEKVFTPLPLTADSIEEMMENLILYIIATSTNPAHAWKCSSYYCCYVGSDTFDMISDYLGIELM